jgi:ABC-2 type transport system permease protein
MLRSVLGRVLHDQARATVVWALVSGLLAAFYLALYPSIGGLESLRSMIEAIPPELRAVFLPSGSDLSTASGYLNVELFTFVLPLIVIAIGVMGGSDATAGEEERGTMELLLANPVRRWVVVVEKSMATAIVAATTCAGVWVALAITATAMGIDLAVDRVAEALLLLWLLAMVYAGIASLVGALAGRRGAAAGIAAVAAIAAFFVNALAPLSDTVEPLRVLSPHFHYIGGDPLTQGIDPVHGAVLVVLAAGLAILSAAAFERRDLRT